MTSKQNLFLFIEDSEIDYDISSKLVQLSMNRFVVEEEDQNEVSGIYHFQKVQKPMIDKNDPLFKNFVKQRTEKEGFDKDILSDALEYVMLNKESVLFYNKYVTGYGVYHKGQMIWLI